MATSYVIAAREYLAAGDRSTAKLELDSALRLSPNNLMANTMMGDYYRAEENYSRAILNYDKAILMNSGDANLFMKRANMHRLLSNHRIYVLRDYDQAILLDSDNTDFYLEKADYLANTINPDTHDYDFIAAAATLSEAIAIDKKDPNLYYLRSRYLVGSEQYLSALSDINKAIAMRPNSDKYYAERAKLNFNMGRYQGSYNDYTRAISINGNEYSYYESRGHANFNLGQYPEAYDDYSIAIEMIIGQIASAKGSITPSDPINKSLRLTLLYRGMSLVQDNRPYDGCDDFERAYKMGELKARNYMRQYCN